MVKKKKYRDIDLLMNPVLFDEDFIVKPVEIAKQIISTELQIAKGSKPILSKQQQRFNQLIKKIENCEKEIENTKTLGYELDAFYKKNIIPVEKDFGDACFVWAKVLHEFAIPFKLTESQRDKLDSHIIELCNIALSYIEPNEEQKVFYDSYSFISYKDKIESEKQDIIDEFHEFMRDEMNVDMKDIPFDPDDAEKTQEYLNKLLEKLENKKNEDRHNWQKQENQTKTKKQIEKEQQKLLEDELTKKSLRSVYISLAKILHPDTETDQQLIAEKSELMKKVTVAYEQKDLSTLLKLEMEWVHQTAENLQLLTEDKLKLYNGILQDQLNDLQNELYAIKMNPAFLNVSSLLNYNKNYALSILKANKTDMLGEIEQMKINIAAFKKQPAKKNTLTNYLKDVELEEYADDDDFGEFLNNLMSRF
ncbi:MAG: hypothetical protein Q7U47_08750 [Paludibacter sp.]|nr:hypothetical protein [Paludibacter sp.]